MSRILNHHQRDTLTTAAGTVAVNIDVTHSMLRQIIVRAATATTTFDVTLTDIYSEVVLERTNILSALNELLEVPTYGNWTLTISNASADEAFAVKTIFNDKH